MKRRAATESLRRLCRALLLPFLLLCVQQGAFLHELSHYEPAEVQDEDHPQDAHSACELCLAFAHIETVAGPAPQPHLLLAGLSFALIAAMVTFARAAKAPALHNRGPPVLR